MVFIFHKTFLRRAILAAFVSFPFTISAQDTTLFPATGTRLEKEEGGVIVRITVIHGADWWELWHRSEALAVATDDPVPEAEAVTGREAIDRLLPTGARMETEEVGIGQEKLDRLLCFTAANGIKVVIHMDELVYPVLYPREGVLAAMDLCEPKNVRLLLDVATGEDGVFPWEQEVLADGRMKIENRYSPAYGTLRVVSYFDEWTNGFREVGALDDIFRRHADHHPWPEFEDHYFWFGNNLYVREHDRYYRISLRTDKTAITDDTNITIPAAAPVMPELRLRGVTRTGTR